MKVIDCVQGSPEWLEARLGVPTASNFDRIVTAKTLKPSASAPGYLARLAAEWFLRVPLDDVKSGFMERGTELEPEAARHYEAITDADCTPVGFVLTDDETAGCSPDRLVGDDGLCEIKCPSAEVAMRYHLAGGTDEYALQVQGQLWVTGRKWCDLVLYHPTIPTTIVRVLPDPAVFKALDTEIPKFAAALAEAKAKLESKRPALAYIGGDDDHGF